MKSKLQNLNLNEILKGLLWIEDWWDGIVSGVAEIKGRRIYFNCISEDDQGNRDFAVYNPPNEIWKLIDERHEDFKKYVNDADVVQFTNGQLKRETGNLRPQSEHSKYWKKWKDRKIEMNQAWQIAIANYII